VKPFNAKDLESNDDLRRLVALISLFELDDESPAIYKHKLPIINSELRDGEIYGIGDVNNNEHFYIAKDYTSSIVEDFNNYYLNTRASYSMRLYKSPSVLEDLMFKSMTLDYLLEKKPFEEFTPKLICMNGTPSLKKNYFGTTTFENSVIYYADKIEKK
jgi:hypothetical protein